MVSNTNIALIGAGFISAYHVDGIRAAGSASLSILVGRLADKSAQRAKELGIPRSVTDIDTVLADPDIKGVIVATPDATHKPLAIAALEAGKAVLLQKPMAVSSQECRDIIAVAERAGAPLSVSFMHRYFAEVRWLKAKIAEGEFGPIHTIRLRNATPGAGWADWFFDPQSIGGGVVMQLGVHGIDLLQHVFGPISSVSAICSTVKPRIQLDDGREMEMPFEDNAFALYRFAAGYTATHEMSWTEVAGCDRFRLEVYFQDATVWLRADGIPAQVIRPGSSDAGDRELVNLDPEPLGKAHHANWLDVISGMVPADDTAAAGLSTLIIGEHIYRAAREAKTLDIVE